MTAIATTETDTFRWVAYGFTDDVTDCQHCGKANLKGTVRMLAVNADNENLGDCYMGVVCAARMSGRKAAEIRTEAARADRKRSDAARALWMAWMDAQSVDFCARRDAVLGRNARPKECIEWSRTDEAKAGDAAWLLANPEPPRSW